MTKTLFVKFFPHNRFAISLICLARLDNASEKIEQFNAEEEAYGWDNSQYPQKKSLETTLAPYHKLYEVTVDFNNKNKYTKSF